MTGLTLTAIPAGPVPAGDRRGGSLLMLLVDACWLAVTYRRVEAAEAKRAPWAREVICLACTERFEP